MKLFSLQELLERLKRGQSKLLFAINQNQNIVNTETKTASEIRDERMPTYQKYIKWMWRLLGFGIAFVVLLFLGLTWFGGIPSTERLENPSISLATEVLSVDEQVLGRFYHQNRVVVRYDQLSPHLISALIATEDERFREHSGIDAKSLGRVLVKTVLGGNESSGGGSTISQQLAKLLFTGKPARNIRERAFQKLKEWITAVKLESRYTKEEIIAMYLNEFSFTNGAYGIKSASEIYFSESQDSLKIQNAALLIGMLKNPSLYNPKRFPDRAINRRNVVLSQMKKNGVITQEEYDELKVKELGLNFNRTSHNDGLAPYFREELRKEVKRLLKNQTKSDGSNYDVHKDGLKIYTTIDARMQKHAEAAAWNHLKSLQNTFFKHWKNKDPWTYKGRKTTNSDLLTRENSFNRLVSESDRYLIIRQNMVKKIEELELRDADILRMLRIKEEGFELADTWLEKGFINKKLYNLYKKTLGGEDWTALKSEWDALQKAKDKEFNKYYKMKVFSYNKEGETDTLMTPYDSIRYHRMILQTGMLSVNPKTGEIKTWVGGVNYKYFKFDHANKNVARQVGSTFKPYLYALSIERGISPCQKIIDQPITFEAGTFGLYRSWTPKNASNSYSGAEYDLKRALKQSKNSISAYLMRDLGSVEPLQDFVSNMGIKKSRIPLRPSICLGAADLSVFEMTGAYTSFANAGKYTEPYFISRIEDKNGNVIYEKVPEQKEVLSKGTAAAMVNLLKGVVSGAGGFGGIKSEVGGKTGTTNDHTDGWFMGITPNLVVGTWVGGDDRWVRFRTITYGQGARMARPIFSDFLKRLENDKKIAFDVAARFERPEGDNGIEMNCELYDYSGDEETELYDSISNGTEGDYNSDFGNEF
ncbi:MAG: penicillin-binding protein 1A [Cognaticolwellia sp.]|jgi:penicillin-binding protein 1A